MERIEMMSWLPLPSIEESHLDSLHISDDLCSLLPCETHSLFIHNLLLKGRCDSTLSEVS